MRITSSGFRPKTEYLRFFCVLVMLLLLFTGTGCSVSEKGGRRVYVSIVDSVFFTADNSSGSLERGENYTVLLAMLNGYVPVSCNYSGEYSLEKTEENVYALTLQDVSRPARVTVVSASGEKTVAENPVTECTVTFIYNNGTDESRTVEYTLSDHLRPNTINGTGIDRDGYTLIGWNTEPDGTGEHIGLGSRCTVGDGDTLVLYGEWAEWTDTAEFAWTQLSAGSAAITGYRGDGTKDPFVIPGEISGKKVTVIQSSFTSSMPCGSLSASVLILPDTIETVADGAFKKSSFEEVYFFDNLESITGKAFQYGIKTYHVNAAVDPCLQKDNLNTRFADNLDILILNADRKKLLFFSGCSFMYGLDSAAVDESFGGEYVVVNMGLNGEFNALFQMEIMLPYITEGDVFIHAPEEMSPYQFLGSMVVDGRIFAMVEGNYDLFALADFSYSTSILNAYSMYNNLRDGQESCAYSDSTDMFNKYGDLLEERPYDESTELERDIAYSEDYGYDTDLLTEENITTLAGIYGKFEERGAKVYLSFAPVNRNCSQETEIDEKAAEFEETLISMMEPYGYTVISAAADYLYPGRYFYDADYHLNELGVLLRTKQLIADMKAADIGAA